MHIWRCAESAVGQTHTQIDEMQFRQIYQRKDIYDWSFLIVVNNAFDSLPSLGSFIGT